MHRVPDWFYTQSAVIPHRRGNGGIELLLVTSRKRKRWVLPKGVKEPHLSAAASAAKEAAEEAGILGDVLPNPVGSYTYEKWGGTCTVEVFLMAVEKVLDRWPEDFRDREWLSPEEAARRVDEPGLKKLLLLAAQRLTGS